MSEVSSSRDDRCSDSGSSIDDQPIDIKHGRKCVIGFASDIDDSAFSREVKWRAHEIAKELEKNGLDVKRVDKKKELEFYALYQALLEVPVGDDQIPEALTPSMLANILKFPKTKISKVLPKISKFDHKREIFVAKPEHFLKSLMKSTGVDDPKDYEELLKLTRIPNLKELDDFPQNVACGIVCYYLTKITKGEMKESEFAKKICMSSMTVNKIVKRVKKIIDG